MLFWMVCTELFEIEIDYIFPYPGHSYFDPDRLFRVIEKKIRTKKEFVVQKDYQDLIETSASLKLYKKDFRLKKMEFSVEKFKKLFKIPKFKDVRKLSFKKSKVGYTYKYDSEMTWVKTDFIANKTKFTNSNKKRDNLEKYLTIKRNIAKYLKKLGYDDTAVNFYEK